MLIPGTFTICPRAVALYAHRIARLYASGTTPYRLAFKWGMKDATEFAMGVRDIAIADAEAPAEVRRARDELLFWQCQPSYSDNVRARPSAHRQRNRGRGARAEARHSRRPRHAVAHPRPRFRRSR